DGALDELRLPAQLVELSRMKQQLANAVADQADRRLEAGDQQADRLRQQLLRRQPIALGLGADEAAQYVVGEAAAPLVDQPFEIFAETAAGGRGGGDHLGRRE